MELLDGYFHGLIEAFPEVANPQQMPNRQRHMTRRVVFSLICLLIFLTLSSIPIYGAITIHDPRDPLHLQRMLLSANRGSLLELGLSPIITSGMLLQLLESAGLIIINQSNRADRVFMRKARKCSAVLISLIESIVLVAAGMLKISVVTVAVKISCNFVYDT